MIVKGNHLNGEGFYVLQTFQQKKATFTAKNAEKITFVTIILLRVNSLISTLISTWHQPFMFKSNFNRKNPNLMYIIICSGCSKEYIGQTRRQLKKRLSIYRHHIRPPEFKKMEIGRHVHNVQKEYLIFSFLKNENITKSLENATKIISLKF